MTQEEKINHILRTDPLANAVYTIYQENHIGKNEMYEQIIIYFFNQKTHYLTQLIKCIERYSPPGSIL